MFLAEMVYKAENKVFTQFFSTARLLKINRNKVTSHRENQTNPNGKNAQREKVDTIPQPHEQSLCMLKFIYYLIKGWFNYRYTLAHDETGSVRGGVVL